MHTILLATDGSPSAKKATTTAIDLAKATGWKLRVVAVWQIPVYEYGYLPLQYTPELVEAASGHAATVVKEAVEAARELSIVITDDQAELDPFVFELPAEIPSLLSHPG